ncbi:MAG: hypothetical protein PV344_04700, partial [Anaplasma sp.]|nr:hypothetical protein [Anaplasma sp.]
YGSVVELPGFVSIEEAMVVHENTLGSIKLCRSYRCDCTVDSHRAAQFFIVVTICGTLFLKGLCNDFNVEIICILYL